MNISLNDDKVQYGSIQDENIEDHDLPDTVSGLTNQNSNPAPMAKTIVPPLNFSDISFALSSQQDNGIYLKQFQEN